MADEVKHEIEFFTIGSKKDDEAVMKFFREHEITKWQVVQQGLLGDTIMILEYLKRN